MSNVRGYGERRMCVQGAASMGKGESISAHMERR